MCTELGPLVARSDAGGLRGRLGDALVEGQASALRVTDRGVLVYEGPLTGLGPVPPAAPPPATGPHGRALAHAALAGSPTCEPTQVRIGAWPDPIAVPAGARVSRRSPSDVWVRGPAGDTHLVSLVADRATAQSLAAEVDRVFFREGRVLAVQGPLVLSGEPVRPGAALGLAALLDLDLPTTPVVEVEPAFREGAEVAAAVDRVRAEVGLGPLRWDRGLADAALQHAAWLAAHEPAVQTHRQEPGDPLFVGVLPEERGGDRELLLRLGHATPEEALVHWLAAPYHRMPLLHPGATALGVARVGRSWVAEVRVDEAIPPTGGWPTGDVVVPTGRFDGHEQPDPLPSWRYPEARYPVGFPVTVWGARGGAEATLRCDGAEVPFWTVDAALGTPREAVHLVPKAPLPPGAHCAWTARFTVDELPRSAEGSFSVASPPLAPVEVPEAVAAVLRTANEARAGLGLPALVPSAAARARSRLLSARSRAMQEGLPPAAVPGLSGADPGEPAPIQLCTRPDEPFDLDEAWLAAEVRGLGADEAAVVVTWSQGPEGARVRLAAPRTCVWLFREP